MKQNNKSVVLLILITKETMKEIIYITYDGRNFKIPYSDYNKWVIETILFIWEKEGWEETQDAMFESFYKDVI